MRNTILIGDPAKGIPISLSDFSDKTFFYIKHAVNQIFDSQGDVVRILPTKLLQPGINNSLAANIEETVWLQGVNETFVSTNVIDTVSSSSASDTGEVTIGGNTVDGSGNFINVSQTATLNGQTKVVLTTPLARVDYVRNTSASNWVGDIYVYQDGAITAGVPNTASTIHAKGDAARNRSFKASRTTAWDEYLLLTDVYASVSRGNATANVDVQLQIREKGKIFITEIQFTVSAGAGIVIPFRPFLVVNKNADVRIQAITDTNATAIEAGFQGFFARIV